MPIPPPQIKKPTYPIDAVDNALLLIQMLRDEGALKLGAAARELGVAPSTAHRVLAMLVFRGFAVRDAGLSYLPGPAMSTGAVAISWAGALKRHAREHMESLVEYSNETVNLMVRTQMHVRVVQSIESSQMLRVCDRQGVVLPAALASGGRALLAELPGDDLRRIYTGELAQRDGLALGPDAFRRLVGVMRATRHRAYGVNRNGTEAGVSAIGVAIHDVDGGPLGALCVALPSVRFTRTAEQNLAEALFESRGLIEGAILASARTADPGVQN